MKVERPGSRTRINQSINQSHVTNVQNDTSIWSTCVVRRRWTSFWVDFAENRLDSQWLVSSSLTKRQFSRYAIQRDSYRLSAVYG